MSKLARLSRISPRTLRYYDEINLLRPERLSTTGYRIYAKSQVDRLQQILFYKTLGVPLDEIGQILDNPEFDPIRALHEHHQKLIIKKDQLEALISTIEKSIINMKGGKVMSDMEKFEGFNEKLIQENEQYYGDELRREYGEESVLQSYDKMRNMTKKEHENAKKMGIIILEKLKESVCLTEELGHLDTSIAREIFTLHKDWIMMYWPSYSVEGHKGLADMYVSDERFKSYYDKEQVGCAAHLREIIHYYAK